MLLREARLAPDLYLNLLKIFLILFQLYHKIIYKPFHQTVQHKCMNTLMSMNKSSAYCMWFCLYWHIVAFQLASAASASQPAATPPEAAPVSDLQPDASAGDCELATLQMLGWQQAYNPSGYSINTKLPSNCSLDTWQSLGCLQSLTNLTLTGSLPGLPDSWAHDGSFSTLQTMNFSLSGLDWLTS